MKRLVAPCALAIGIALAVTACSDPYDPGQRAVGGGFWAPARVPRSAAWRAADAARWQEA